MAPGNDPPPDPSLTAAEPVAASSTTDPLARAGSAPPAPTRSASTGDASDDAAPAASSGTAGAPPDDGDLAELLALARALDDERRKVRKAIKKARRYDQLAPKYERQEIASAGFDDFLQTIGGDPSGGSSSFGIRIPSLAGIDPSTGKPIRYLILGAVADLNAGDYVVGWRNLLTIAALIPSVGEAGPAAPFYRMERLVETPGWRPQDAAYSFHLTYEPLRPQRTTQGPFDQESFVLEDAGGPAMVYETASFPVVPTAPGYLGLDGYSAPVMLGTEFHCARDVRDPWTKGAFEYMRFPITIPTRIRAYISVLQTNPPTRHSIVIANTAFAAASIPPEESFLQVFNAKTVPGGVQFHRGAVSLLIDRRIAA